MKRKVEGSAGASKKQVGGLENQNGILKFIVAGPKGKSSSAAVAVAGETPAEIPKRSPPPVLYKNATLRVTFPYAKILGKVMQRMESVGNSCVLDFDRESGLTIRQFDPTKALTSVLRIPKDVFLKYEMKKHACSYVLNFHFIKEISDMCKHEHTATIIDTPDEPDRLLVRMHSAQSNRVAKLPLKEPFTGETPTFDVPDSAYPVHAELPMKTFADEVSCCNKMQAANVKFCATPNCFIFVAENSGSILGREIYESTTSATITFRHPSTTNLRDPNKYHIKLLSSVSQFHDVASHVVIHFGADKTFLKLLLTCHSPDNPSSPLATITIFLADDVSTDLD